MKKPRTYKQLQQDPRVSDWSDERSRGAFGEHDGLWIYLAPGWVTGDGLLTIHEDTVFECCDCLFSSRYSPEEWTAAMDPMDEGLHSMLPAG